MKNTYFREAGRDVSGYFREAGRDVSGYRVTMMYLDIDARLEEPLFEFVLDLCALAFAFLRPVRLVRRSQVKWNQLT